MLKKMILAGYLKVVKLLQYIHGLDILYKNITFHKI